MKISRAVGAALLPCVSAAAYSSSVSYPGNLLEKSSFSEYGDLVMGSNVHGKLDIFLDLADPKSAKAWPTLKSAAHENEDTMVFVFHAFPLSGSPIAKDYAKAAHLIAEHSGDAEVETFFDLAFSYHNNRRLASFRDVDGDSDTSSSVSHQETRGPLSDLDAGDLLAELVQSSTSMDSHQYESGMRDPAYDELVRQAGKKTSTSTTSTPSASSYSSYMPLQGRTPAVYLDGEFMTYLDGEEELENFELSLKSGLLSRVSDSNRRGGGVGAPYYPLWMKLQDGLRMLEDDLRQQERHELASGSAKYPEPEPNDLYTYLGDSSRASPANDAGGAATDGDAALRSDLLEEGASLLNSAALITNDEDESWTSYSPSSQVSEKSHASDTLSRYSSEFYLYDDTTGEIQREQAPDHGARRPSPAAVVQ